MSDTQQFIGSVSCWFINRMWNNLYLEVCNDENIIESYRVVLLKFNSSFKSNIPIERKYDTPYNIIIENIQQYYNEKFNRSKNINQFTDMVYRVIVGNREADEPASAEQKENVVRGMITSTVSTFIVHLANNESDNIVNRDCNEIPNAWRLKFVKVLENKIREYRSLVVAGRNGVDIMNGVDVEMVPLTMVTKYEQKIRELLNEKQAMIVEHNNLIHVVQTLKNLLERKQREINEMVTGVPEDNRFEPEEIVMVEDIVFESMSSGDEFEYNDL